MQFPLWWLAPPPCPLGSVSLDSQSPTAPCESSSLATRWEACHWIRGSQSSPMNQVPLPPPQFGGASKGKRLNGQARRLTSPDLHILCRMCTVDNKALKGSLYICDSTVSTGYSAPRSGGWQRNWIHRGAPRPANPVTCFPPGKVVAPATKGGMHFLARQGGCKGFIIRGRLL